MSRPWIHRLTFTAEKIDLVAVLEEMQKQGLAASTGDYDLYFALEPDDLRQIVMRALKSETN